MLDYIVINQKDEKAVDEMIVDEGKEFAPTTADPKKDTTTSDHNALIAKLDWLIETNSRKQAPRTTITKKGYKRIEEGIQERNLVDIFKKDEPVEKLYAEFKEEVNKLVEENQIKVKKNNRRKSIRVLIKAKKKYQKENKDRRCKIGPGRKVYADS